MHAFYNEFSDSKDEDCPLKASKMKDLRPPAKPLHRNEMNIDATITAKEESKEEDYHMVTATNQTHHRQDFQKF